MANERSSRVLVRIPLALSALTDGRRLLRVPGRTVGEVLSALEDRYPALHSMLRDSGGQLRQHILVFLDSQDIRARESENTPVSAESEVAILSAIEGG